MSELNKQEKRDTIAAVVVTYNRKELLIECLDALMNQTYPLDGIYIIDNASSDGTPELLLEKGYINKPLFPENEPMFTKDYNEALTFAEYDIKSNWTIYRASFLGGENNEDTN